MHGRTRDNPEATVLEPSLRLVANETALGFAPRRAMLPLPGVRRTLIVADTSGLHHRGPARAGTVRQALRPTGAENDGGMRRRSPFRRPAD